MLFRVSSTPKIMCSLRLRSHKTIRKLFLTLRDVAPYAYHLFALIILILFYLHETKSIFVLFQVQDLTTGTLSVFAFWGTSHVLMFFGDRVLKIRLNRKEYLRFDGIGTSVMIINTLMIALTEETLWRGYVLLHLVTLLEANLATFLHAGLFSVYHIPSYTLQYGKKRRWIHLTFLALITLCWNYIFLVCGAPLVSSIIAHFVLDFEGMRSVTKKFIKSP